MYKTLNPSTHYNARFHPQTQKKTLPLFTKGGKEEAV